MLNRRLHPGNTGPEVGQLVLNAGIRQRGLETFDFPLGMIQTPCNALVGGLQPLHRSDKLQVLRRARTRAIGPEGLDAVLHLGEA